MNKQQLTTAAGKAAAHAVRTLNAQGLTAEAAAAGQDAERLATAALNAGATLAEIRHASGLDTSRDTP